VNNGALHADGYHRTVKGNFVLEVEPTSQHGAMNTGSGQNSLDLERFTLSVFPR